MLQMPKNNELKNEYILYRNTETKFEYYKSQINTNTGNAHKMWEFVTNITVKNKKGMVF